MNTKQDVHRKKKRKKTSPWKYLAAGDVSTVCGKSRGDISPGQICFKHESKSINNPVCHSFPVLAIQRSETRHMLVRGQVRPGPARLRRKGERKCAVLHYGEPINKSRRGKRKRTRDRWSVCALKSLHAQTVHLGLVCRFQEKKKTMWGLQILGFSKFQQALIYFCPPHFSSSGTLDAIRREKGMRGCRAVGRRAVVSLGWDSKKKDMEEDTKAIEHFL